MMGLSWTELGKAQIEWGGVKVDEIRSSAYEDMFILTNYKNNAK